MDTNIEIQSTVSLKDKVIGYLQLLKFRLSFIVTFSGVMSYILAIQSEVNYPSIILFAIGGFLVTGSANIINQIIEKKYDRLMKRTENRPLPTGVLSNFEAIVFCVLLGVVGLFIHFNINFLTGCLSLLSLILYGFVYTPLKRVGPIAVFVGAIPGALPTLIGWSAATGDVNYMGWILFGIQFLWQFPHFWAIAWVAHDDYTNAGFKLLPSNGARDLNTAFNIMIYTLFLLPASMLPFFFEATGKVSAVIVTIAGLLFLSQTFLLMKKCDKKAAMQMMFGSFLYLPIVQIAFVLDKL